MDEVDARRRLRSQSQGATIGMNLKKNTKRLAQQLFGAIAFYTTIPISARWTLDFTRIARWSPFVGFLIGVFLVLIDGVCQLLLPMPLGSTVVVLGWVWVTGALHLDGAMDTADGLGVWDRQKRLDVMSDSRSGAFGVIAAIAILMLKSIALMSVSSARPLALLWIPVWARCAHVWAVGRYPYLKSEGKARLHHDSFVPGWDYIPGLMLQMLFAIAMVALQAWPNIHWLVGSYGVAIGLSWGIGYWFFRKLGGVTGDIHGAIVEWTETILLLSWVAARSN